MSSVAETQFDPGPVAGLLMGKRRRIVLSAENPLFYLKTYMPDYFPKDWGRFHREGAQTFLDLARAGSRTRENVIAPRSVAKSTFFSVGLPVFCATMAWFAKKHFIVVISDTFNQAVSNVEAIKTILETNELIAQDFGKLATAYWSTERIMTQGDPKLMEKLGGLPEDEEEKIPPPRFMVGDADGGTLIIALGSTMKIRGRKFRQWRPDLIILDDPENDEQVASASQRQKTQEWFYDAVMPAGSVDGFSVLTLGTALNEDCLVENIRRHDLSFNSRLYKMVESWPFHTELWEECRKIFIDLSLKDERREKALEFYFSNRRKMDRDFRLLQNWASDVREENPYFDIMVLLWTRGASFWKERQNEPGMLEERLFDWEKFTKFTKILVNGRLMMRDESDDVWGMGEYHRVAVGIDPAEGTSQAKSQKGELDYCAIAAMGLHADGYKDVFEVKLSKEGAEAEIASTLDMCRRWGATDLYIEKNMYQGLASLFRLAMEARSIRINIHPVLHTAKQHKAIRIATMEPDINAGHLRFCDDMPEEARNQFTRFRAGAKHDDAPDVIEMVWKKLTKGQSRYVGDFSEITGKQSMTSADRAVDEEMAPVCEGIHTYTGHNIHRERRSRIATYCRKFAGCETIAIVVTKTGKETVTKKCPIAEFLKWKTPVENQFVRPT